MNYARTRYHLKRLARNVWSYTGLTTLLSSLGALYLILQGADYFKLAKQSDIQPYWWLFLCCGAVVTVWKCRPRLSVKCKLKDRDISIEIAIGNLFSFQGAFIVGTNTTFDTQISSDLIDESSIQGQFTRRYYRDHTSLDRELNAELKGIICEGLPGPRMGKACRYPVGTVVKLRPKECIGYFVAICDLNEHGNASGSFDGLKQALGQLWIFIGNRGGKEKLIMPVMGTGFMRLKPGRQVITQEIIKSFIAACSEKTFCEQLTIVVGEKDALNNGVDLDALGSYLQHLCMYTEFSVGTTEPVGTAVP